MCLGEQKKITASRQFSPLFLLKKIMKIMMAAKERIFLRTNGSKLHYIAEYRSSLHM